jgi:hypothetical protein
LSRKLWRRNISPNHKECSLDRYRSCKRIPVPASTPLIRIFLDPVVAYDTTSQTHLFRPHCRSARLWISALLSKGRSHHYDAYLMQPSYKGIVACEHSSSLPLSSILLPSVILSRLLISSAHMTKERIRYPFQVIVSATTHSPIDFLIMRAVASGIRTVSVDYINTVLRSQSSQICSRSSELYVIPQYLTQLLKLNLSHEIMWFHVYWIL